MKNRLIASISFAVLAVSGSAFAFDGWHQESATTIDSKTSAFDYVQWDAKNNRLLIGHRKEGLQAFDPAQKSVTVVGDTPAHSSNGATLMPEFDLGVANNEDGTLTPFKLSTLEAQPGVKVSAELDTSHYDTFSKRLFVTAAENKDGQDIVVVDAPSLKVAGTISLPTKKAEGAAADGAGNLYQAEQDIAKIAVIDTKAMTVKAQWETPGCPKPTGVAVDAANKRLFVGCRSKDSAKAAFIVMNTETGKVVYTSEIGDGNDGVVYDAELKRIFMADGVSATLNVFEQKDADTYAPTETLATRQWVKVLDIDPKTKKLYSIVAEASADAAKKINKGVSPFYPNTVFPNTFTILTYTK